MDWNITVDVKRVSEKVGVNVPQPFYATPGAAGMDLCACIDGELTIGPGERVQVPTGIAIKMPPHVVGLVFARSGHAWRAGITLANAVGVIDADYTGEIKVLLTNLDRVRAFTVRPGERIAQLAFIPVFSASLNWVDQLDSTVRGGGGFGSTGR